MRPKHSSDPILASLTVQLKNYQFTSPILPGGTPLEALQSLRAANKLKNIAEVPCGLVMNPMSVRLYVCSKVRCLAFYNHDVLSAARMADLFLQFIGPARLKYPAPIERSEYNISPEQAASDIENETKLMPIVHQIKDHFQKSGWLNNTERLSDRRRIERLEERVRTIVPVSSVEEKAAVIHDLYEKVGLINDLQRRTGELEARVSVAERAGAERNVNALKAGQSVVMGELDAMKKQIAMLEAQNAALEKQNEIIVEYLKAK